MNPAKTYAVSTVDCLPFNTSNITLMSKLCIYMYMYLSHCILRIHRTKIGDKTWHKYGTLQYMTNIYNVYDDKLWAPHCTLSLSPN